MFDDTFIALEIITPLRGLFALVLFCRYVIKFFDRMPASFIRPSMMSVDILIFSISCLKNHFKK